MWQLLNRKLKRWLFRTDYERMARAARAGKYTLAADIAHLLGEVELMRRYEALERMKMRLAQTVPADWNPYRLCALEYRLKNERMN